MLVLRTLTGLLGSSTIHIAGAAVAPELFRVEVAESYRPTIICLCIGVDDRAELRTTLLFVEASRRAEPGPTAGASIGRFEPPCPPEAPLERLAEPRPLNAKAAATLRRAAPARPSICAKVRHDGVVLRAYLTGLRVPIAAEPLLSALRSVRFDAARRDGRTVTAWHRLTVQLEPSL